MQNDFETQWRRARSLENEGDPLAAKAIYETLLRSDPERLYVRLRMSAIEQLQGNYRASREHALRAAETVRHARWGDLAVVTRRLLAFGENAVVRSLIMGVDWNDPEILKSSAILSQHLWLIDDVAEALRMIDIARLRAPSSHILSYSRANALRYFGRMDDATAEYERCLSLEPSYVYAHWSLAYHEKSNPLGSRIDRIKRAQAAFTDSAPEQAYLHYALFKEFDDAGEVDQAWSSLQAGARIKRQSLRYDSTLEEQGFLALQQVTGNVVASQAQEIASNRVPIFIVGMPRSGTTLLERILGNHSQVVAAGELNDFNDALCWESNQFLGTELTPQAVERLRDIDYSNVGKNYLERTREKAGGSRYLIDKNPMNFVNAGYIGRALPQAKIICLRRGAMDSCFSNLKELFSNDAYGYSYDLMELADYYTRFDRLSGHWRQLLPGQFLEVGYEDLVENPLAVTETIMGFCGMPFEPDCVDITKNTAPVSTASSSQVRQPINKRGVDAWRKYAKYLEPLRSRLAGSLPDVPAA